MRTERWLPIPGYEGWYEVSDQGRVRSLPRTVIRSDGSPLPLKGRNLKLVKQKRGGYPGVYLPPSRSRRAPIAKVHHLVLLAFVGPRPTGMECCHENDDPEDNRLSNLRWDTPKGNAKDKLRNSGPNHQARKTHCPQGHEYTPENTLIKPSEGRRRCRTCVLKANRDYDYGRRRRQGVAA